MLDGIFNADNPFFRFMNRIADMIVLNVLFVISCIPVVTIGAALTSMYYVAITTWSREDGYIFKLYTKSFRQNFKQATCMWLILLAVGVVLGVDTWFWIQQWKLTGNGIFKPLTVISVALLFVYAMLFTYVWPLLAKFSNTIKGTFKNAIAMAVTHVPETLLLWLIFGAMAVSVAFVNIARVAAVFIAFSIVAYLQALLFRHVFKPYLGEETKRTPEEDAELVGYENTYADARIEAARLAQEMEQERAQEEEGEEEDAEASGEESLEEE